MKDTLQGSMLSRNSRFSTIKVESWKITDLKGHLKKSLNHLLNHPCFVGPSFGIHPPTGERTTHDDRWTSRHHLEHPCVASRSSDWCRCQRPTCFAIGVKSFQIKGWLMKISQIDRSWETNSWWWCPLIHKKFAMKKHLNVKQKEGTMTFWYAWHAKVAHVVQKMLSKIKPLKLEKPISTYYQGEFLVRNQPWDFRPIPNFKPLKISCQDLVGWTFATAFRKSILRWSNLKKHVKLP